MGSPTISVRFLTCRASGRAQHETARPREHVENQRIKAGEFVDEDALQPRDPIRNIPNPQPGLRRGTLQLPEIHNQSHLAGRDGLVQLLVVRHQGLRTDQGRPLRLQNLRLCGENLRLWLLELLADTLGRVHQPVDLTLRLALPFFRGQVEADVLRVREELEVGGEEAGVALGPLHAVGDGLLGGAADGLDAGFEEEAVGEFDGQPGLDVLREDPAAGVEVVERGGPAVAVVGQFGVGDDAGEMGLALVDAEAAARVHVLHVGVRGVVVFSLQFVVAVGGGDAREEEGEEEKGIPHHCQNAQSAKSNKIRTTPYHNKSINQSNNQAFTHSVHQSINQSIKSARKCSKALYCKYHPACCSLTTV